MIYEENIIQKNLKAVDLRVGLCYPNIYRTAMSSLGYNILYDFINQNQKTFAERIIYPSVRSIETNSPLKDFDIISFSLQYEEDYFNVVRMLNEAGIPIKREDRTADDPLIIAGGPCATSNPAPMSEFIDLFIIGEGEVNLNNVFETYGKFGKDLEKYLKIPGVYIPEFNNKAKIAIVEDMADAHHITTPVITTSENEDYQTIFKDSIMLNVSRGCTRGCRFCMSSYLYRPMRETSLEKLVNIAEQMRNNTGLNKVTLIGAAVSDYSNIVELIDELEKRNFEISTPSLRLESITRKQLELLRQANLKTITIAPESIGKLRKGINKEIPDEKIFEVVKNAFDLNFNMKLYFIIGLPNETMDDIRELVEFMKKIASFRKNNSIRFSVNPLIPKPHTPLQWETYDLKDIKRKMRFIKKEMKNYKIKFESPKKGMIQYILSCGNRAVSQIIEKSLTENITMKEWKKYLPDYSLEDPLPWDNIDVGVKKKFLEREYRRIETGKQTPWCDVDVCYNCGACNK
ncbi:MAG: radical SAM protein [Methanobrevibacter sp.]|uniref:radical SAM protein n=1 Tax=Methanobrevibacter sp. TaxID=66852 RepID=UPI0026DFA081|nr:radical SAM protein [Methanobrevibacter sp.]MDO5848816.1 radical SAM protein [Methanobrevibacter sp.]